MIVFSPLAKFLRLSASDRRFLLKVLLAVWVVRLMLSLLPFRKVRELLTKFATTNRNTAEQFPLEHVAWAVSRASRFVPAASCLTQALVTKLFLGRLGHPATVRIGVARSEAGELQAHAWVESRGKIVIGGSQRSLQRYTPLAAANGELW